MPVATTVKDIRTNRSVGENINLSLNTMAPPRKRYRKDPSSEQKGEIQEQSVKALEKLSNTLNKLGESSSSTDSAETVGLLRDASRDFMKLKSLQQMTLDKLHETQTLLEKQRQIRDEQALKLENLEYQKALNDHSIEMSRKLETSQLLKMCCDELEKPMPESKEESESLLQEFLGADPKDPEQRLTIEAKLSKEINAKGALETELKICQHKLATLKHSLATKRKLLLELPQKLNDMERASLPLQKFCEKSMNASKKLGTQRLTCLDLAQSLPKALYTLFYQLLSCLDTIETSDPSPSLEVANDSTTVVFKLPIPTISDSSGTISISYRLKKIAKIYFEHNEELDMVTAYSSAEHDMGSFIDELFPCDTGEWNGGDGEDEETNPGKRAYHWCNYLAGLHIAPAEQSVSKMRRSTRVVVHALSRRVSAHASLHWLLHSLSRKPQHIPVHPSMKNIFSGSDSSVYISDWAEQTGSGNFEIGDAPASRYIIVDVTLKRKSSTLVVRVRINAARYPGVPPIWEFMTSNSKLSWGEEHGSLDELEKDSALYDENLANLERKINSDIDELVVSTDETSYEWILSHQLAMIAKRWEEIQSST